MNNKTLADSESIRLADLRHEIEFESAGTSAQDVPVGAFEPAPIFAEASTPLPEIEPDLLPDARSEPAFEPATLDTMVAEADPVASASQAEVAVAAELVSTIGKPISDVMEEKLWTVHAEDTIEKVEEIFAAQGLSSAPVVGSNGAIVGMLGSTELAQFHAEGKNAKAVQAWEISRIKTFEVSPTDTVEEVAKLMMENHIEHISVTEFGRLKGIVSSQDLLQEILNVLPGDSAKE